MKDFMKKALFMGVIGLSIGSTVQAMNQEEIAEQDLIAARQQKIHEVQQRLPGFVHPQMSQNEVEQIGRELSMVRDEDLDTVCSTALRFINAGAIRSGLHRKCIIGLVYSSLERGATAQDFNRVLGVLENRRIDNPETYYQQARQYFRNIPQVN